MEFGTFFNIVIIEKFQKENHFELGNVCTNEKFQKHWENVSQIPFQIDIK